MEISKNIECYYFGVSLNPANRGYATTTPELKEFLNIKGPWQTSLRALSTNNNLSYPPQFEACMHYKEGWTLMIFPDRTVDSRDGVYSAFMAKGTFGFDEMRNIAENYFPSIVNRSMKQPAGAQAELKVTDVTAQYFPESVATYENLTAGNRGAKNSPLTPETWKEKETQSRLETLRKAATAAGLVEGDYAPMLRLAEERLQKMTDAQLRALGKGAQTSR